MSPAAGRRRAWRVLAVVLALVALLAGGAAVALRLLGPGPQARAGVERALRAALGGESSFESLAVELWPPRLVARHLVARGEGGEQVRAQRVALAPAWLELLRGRLRARTVESPDAWIMLGDDRLGVRLRGPFRVQWVDGRRRTRCEADATATIGALKGVAGVVWLDVRERDDATNFEVEVRAPPFGRIKGSFELGASAARGRLALEEIDLALLRDALRVEGGKVAIRGRMGGSLSWERSGGTAPRWHVVLTGRPLELRDRELTLRGPVEIEAELSGWPPAGSFRIDARDAELDYAGVVHKPSKVPAELTGRLRIGAGGRLRVSGIGLRTEDFRATLRPKSEGS